MAIFYYARSVGTPRLFLLSFLANYIYKCCVTETDCGLQKMFQVIELHQVKDKGVSALFVCVTNDATFVPGFVTGRDSVTVILTYGNYQKFIASICVLLLLRRD